jgi:DNA mismatch repair protein MutS2
MRDRDLETLAFPAVLEALAARAVSEPGREACRRLRPHRDAAAAERALDRQWSFHRLTETRGPVPLAAFPDVRESLALASHGDAVLPGERLVEIRTVLRQGHALQRFFRGQLAEFPALADLPAALQSFPELEAALGRMLDDAGTLCDAASPRLAELRAALRELRREIEERLERLVADGGAADAVAERYVTVRNNRFVVPIKASAAARVAGVVQDRSASGETLFVEPLFAIELNNRLLLVRKEEELEELRLLGLLTAQVGASRAELGRTLATLAEVDRLAAGAALARGMRATRPALGDGCVDLRGARHPELLLAGRAVVPIDVRIAGERRALVLSGPNTGGKSVALKTLGLLTLMAHAGILVPAEEGSIVPAVGAVLTDFGDEQSVERDLSTFSAHIANLVEVFRELAPPALVLLDEPGVGTDPDEGAALAVALIERLIESGALAAVSTHYAPVKLHALNEPRIEIAAVEVDRVTFEPRYRLLYGSVGESLGLAMARRLALPPAILAAAEAHRDDTARALGDAISRLETTRRRLEDECQAVIEERRALAELEREQAGLVAELRERRRARWSADLEDARAFLRTLKAEGRALLEVTRRRAPDAARTLAEFVRGREEEVARQEAAIAAPAAAPERAPAVGDQVEVQGTMIRGELVELGAQSARVLRGTITYRVPSAQLRTLGAAARPAPPRRADVAGGVRAELNLVGVRAAEALRRLDRFLDQAQAAGVASVRIVHGLGTGALKRAVAEYLAASAYCSGFHEAEPADGGAGVTVADLS